MGRVGKKKMTERGFMPRMIIKTVLILALISMPASPLPCAGQISDEQMKELFQILSKEDLVEAARQRGTPPAETNENATVLGPNDPKNKNDHTTADALNRTPDVPKRSTDAVSNGADEMTEEELVELQR